MAAKKILVLGDRARDEYILPLLPIGGYPDTEKSAAAQDWENRHQWLRFAPKGGVDMMLRMLRRYHWLDVTSVLMRGGTPITSLATLGVCTEDKDLKREVISPERVPKERAALGKFKLRVSRLAGYNENSGRGKEAISFPTGKFNYLAINDAGTELRDPAILKAQDLTDAVGRAGKIVLKMHMPLNTGTLWEAVKGTDDLTLALHADDLRLSGIRLSKGLSWDAVAEDLHRALGTPDSPLAIMFAKATRIVVFCNTEGAAVLDKTPSKRPRVSLVVHPYLAEGDTEAKTAGHVVGAFNCFFSRMVAEIARETDLVGAVGLALTDANAFQRGHYRIARNVLKEPELGPPEETKNGYLTIRSIRPKKTDLVANIVRNSAEGVAERIVTVGPEKALEEERIPHGRFGELVTISRQEIEGLRAIGQLFDRYRADRKDSKPVSIAVFGPPGSGKSFGVKQLVDKTINPILEFNLSEVGVDDLPGFFHQIRDVNLEGKTPLCFFDEFDSHDLSLLASFLAPMQDGQFRDGQSVHPVGRGIFVFAGGTAESMAKFTEDLETTDRITEKEVKAKKKPDFVSRLSGFVDVKGPNRADKDDEAFLLRRAILIRVALKKRFKAAIASGDTLTIRPDLLNALLRPDQEYRHGARSIETIVRQMGASADAVALGPSDLPLERQATFHMKGK